MIVNVLGTNYDIIRNVNESDDANMIDNSGYCDPTNKMICINDMKDYECADKAYNENKVIRHELIHAFLYESGLSVCSEWAENEELVDWMAIQIPKMSAAFDLIDKKVGD